jgi:hypothetical protein
MARYHIEWTFDHMRCRKDLGVPKATEIWNKHKNGEYTKNAEKGGVSFKAAHVEPHSDADTTTKGRVEVEVDENAQVPRPPPEVMRYMHTNVRRVFTPEEHHKMGDKHIGEAGG